MKTYSYNKELLIATAQFKDVFNNIKIYRFDKDDTVTKTIDVPIKYGARSIALKSLTNSKKNVKLPVVSFNRAGFTVDSERLFNFNNDMLVQQDGQNDPTLLHPVPINITFELVIYTMDPSDDDQIVQNFVPFSMPNFYVAWKHPYTDETMKSQVVWSGDISTEYPVDYDTTREPRIITTTAFTYKTWLFAGSDNRSDREDLIHTIISDFYVDDDPFGLYSRIHDAPSGEPYYQDHDTVIYSIDPYIISTDPGAIPIDIPTDLDVYGGLFTEHNMNLYLSGTSGVFENEEPILFKGEDTGLTGIDVDYAYQSDRKLIIENVLGLNNGFIDIILTTDTEINQYTKNASTKGITVGRGDKPIYVAPPEEIVSVVPYIVCSNPERVNPNDPAVDVTLIGTAFSSDMKVYRSGSDGVFENEEPILVNGSPTGKTGLEIDFTVVSEFEIVVDTFTPLVEGYVDFIVVLDEENWYNAWSDNVGVGLIVNPAHEDIGDFEEGRQFGSTIHSIEAEANFITITTLPIANFISQGVKMGFNCNAVFTYAGITDQPIEYINTSSIRMDLYANTEIFEMTVLGTKNIIVSSIKSDFDCTAVHIDMTTGEIIEV